MDRVTAIDSEQVAIAYTQEKRCDESESGDAAKVVKAISDRRRHLLHN